jgi:pimeloyl-ACP methyl ester carboxylesterase
LFLGPRVVLSWRFWIEAGTCLYFLTAAFTVLLLVRQTFLAFSNLLHERWRFSPGVRILVCEVLPLGLVIAFALPYGISFAQVHRFKVPNVADPLTFHGREFEEIAVTSADGARIRGWWIPRLAGRASDGTRGERTLIICHGIAANRSMFLPFVEVGDWLDANVLMFDLRGHGDSDGRTVTLGYREKDDVLAALAYVRREKPNASREVIGLGISLGAATLAQAAPLADPPFDAVILDSSFTSSREMTGSVLNAFPPSTHAALTWLGLPMADWHAGCPMMSVCPEATIDQLRCPVLFLHSRGDPLIPSDHSIRLHARAVEPKRLCVFALNGHCDAFFAQREQYRAEVREIEKAISRRW